MKGVVFTEFLEMVESQMGEDICDQILDETQLASGGAYTAVGTYEASELFALVGKLSEKTNIPVPDLVFAFGKHLFGRFAVGFPQMIEKATGTLELLSMVDGFIHVEVRKLYADANLPKFTYASKGKDRAEVIYESPRCLSRFAAGLMHGAAEHFNETIEISTQDLEPNDGSRVRFELVCKKN